MSTRLRIRAPGLMTTIQDGGRFSYQHIGVPVSGVLDGMSFRIANALVGNEENAAVLECLIAGPDIEAVDGPVRVALAGGAVEARILGDVARAVHAFQSVTLQPGDVLRIGSIRDASCVYLAVEGRIEVEPVLGSHSTYVRGEIGGFHGRPVKAGDEIPTKRSEPSARAELGLPDAPDFGSGPVHIVMGPQEDFFTPDAKTALVESEFIVSKDADRVGIRLEGPRIEHVNASEMTSEGTVTGNIQVPGNGNPIILLMDRSTTAGYPKIATIVSADIPRVARMIPGQKIRFTAISQHDAIAYTRARNRYLKDLIESIRPVVRTDMDSAHLLSVNLIDGVVNAGAD